MPGTAAKVACPDLVFVEGLIIPGEPRFLGPQLGCPVQFRFADHRLDTDRRELSEASMRLPSSRKYLICLYIWWKTADRVVIKERLHRVDLGGGGAAGSCGIHPDQPKSTQPAKPVGDTGKRDQRLIRNHAREKASGFCPALVEPQADGQHRATAQRRCRSLPACHFRPAVDRRSAD